MFKIAIIQFPGTNCEYESYRAIKKAGLKPEFFRWNKSAEELRSYAGYLIPGGFSYEDRVRAGAIAARDPIVSIIAEEAGRGKPVIGICNGAQILVESGLIPGLNGNHLEGALAGNTKGYLNIWVRIINQAEQKRSAFNNYQTGRHFRLPIAHGEGRYVIPENLLQKLIKNDQIIFRYCDEQGESKDEYPVNPNGAIYNIAGICNPKGNVLALMPHPERVQEGSVIFESMRKYLESPKENKFPTGQARIRNQELGMGLKYESLDVIIEEYRKPKHSLEFIVELIITDNEAQTLQTALEQLGYNEVRVRRFTHFEVGLRDDDVKISQLADDLIKSGELLNSNKETAYTDDNSRLESGWYSILVRDKDDFDGKYRLHTLQNRLGLNQINSIKKGAVWQIKCSKNQWQQILDSHILFNTFSQIGMLYSTNS